MRLAQNVTMEIHPILFLVNATFPEMRLAQN